MKDYVASRSRRGISKTDIIAINTMAKKDAASGNKTINASIGTFLDEEKHIGRVQTIDDALSAHLCDNLGYPTVLGDANYLKGVLKYVFKNNLTTIESLYSPFIGSTLGGTGAISHSFNIFLEEGQTVLLPNIMWTNYKLIAEKARLNHDTYQLFDDKGKLNLASIKETIEKTKKVHDRVLLVINDPCQNPTGYCMSEEEYARLFEILDEEAQDTNLTVLFDIAYISFFHIEGKKCALVDELIKKQHNFLPLIGFSTSKLFGLYGLRCGALIALAHDKEQEESISRAFGASARGTYSVPVGPVQSAIAQVLEDEEKMKEIDEEIVHNADVLYHRAKLLVNELDKAQIPYYTYVSGFFLTLKVDDAYGLFEKLKNKHCYVVPMDEKSIRLALSGLNEKEIVELIHTIKGLL